MHFNLARGVDLDVLPTKQFKLNHVLINFTTPQTRMNATARDLLANLLETSTHRYPTQTALARQLAKLYGTYIGIGVSRVGRLHTVRLHASFVNDDVANMDLFNQVIDLINEILFHPLIDQHEFDGPTFRIQANNLRSSLLALYDDKQFYANRQLLKLYYPTDAIQRIPSFGRVSDLAKLSAQSLVSTYQQMIDHDRVNILVLGDVDPAAVQSALAQLPFADRQVSTIAPFYQQSLIPTIKRRTEHQPVTQAKLNLGYQLPIYYRDASYYAGLVFNGLFGGTPYSRLFTNVREKASLAYYATSHLLPFSGLLSVQTGIRSQDAIKVEQLINQQLAALVAGDFSTQELMEVKDSLVNQYEASYDLANNILGRQLLAALLGLPAPSNVTAKIKAVTKKDVQQVAAKLKLQAIYLLSGEK
ncbi:EF-P 5-aminopentanol modification-associated protein YfmF [Limosilactobacillus sp.]|uniref:EF-P 5-aminopentanol modification-associated protein YfmF n=1 Tax=Limosilactobacillus sp. TaxID=2773925 RepID=UPI0035A08987